MMLDSMLNFIQLDFIPDIRKRMLVTPASPVWPPVNQLPRYINTYGRCEQLDRSWETGVKTHVFAFYTSWSGFKNLVTMGDLTWNSVPFNSY